MRNCSADVRMTRGILGEIRRVDQGLPVRISHGCGVAILVSQWDGCNGAPEVVEVFAVPASDLSVRQCRFRQSKHAGRVPNIVQVMSGNVAKRVLPQEWTAVGPEVPNFSLLRSTCGAVECPY